MNEYFLGKQPILDRNQNLVAFELLFRTDQIRNTANTTNDLSATANVIVNTYSQLGIQNTLGQQLSFINVDTQLLMSDTILLLPSKNVVLELLETIKITEDIVHRCSELKRMGYQLALDDVIEINDGIEQLFPFMSVVKVDVLALGKNALSALVNRLKHYPFRLLAEKVETREQASYCMEIGFQLFQGYYFAQPNIIMGKCVDPARLALLKLITLVNNENDINKIEIEVKQQPALIYKLMRIVNSAACSFPQKIDSIKHAIMALGLRHLRRWLQLLLYATEESNVGMTNALLQTAATRGKMMELIFIIEYPHTESQHDRAFMVGVLSLLDVLLSIKMQEIVDILNIPAEMSQALVTRDGRLGKVLKLIEAKEKGDFAIVQEILSELGFLNLNELIQIELEALSGGIRINEAA